MILLAGVLSGCLAGPEPDVAAAAADALASEVAGADAQHAGRILAAVAPFVNTTRWPPGERSIEQVTLLRATSDADGGAMHVVPAFGLMVSNRLHGSDHLVVPAVMQGWGDFSGGDFGAPGSLTDDALYAATVAMAGAPADWPPLANVTARLLALQGPDGGWSWDGDGASGVDETAWVVRALVLTGHGEKILGAADFLRSRQNDEGLFSALGIGANCQSTGLAVQALRWLQEPVPAMAWRALDACRAGPGWSHRPGGAQDAWVTTDVLPAYWPDAVFALRAGPPAAPVADARAS